MKKLIGLMSLLFCVVQQTTLADPLQIEFPKLEAPRLHPVKIPPIWLLKPDLIVSHFEIIGDVTVRGDGFQEVPVRVEVTNQGVANAGIFRLSARYITSNGDYMRPFVAPGQSSQWKPSTMATMRPGDTIAVEGKLLGFPSDSPVSVDFYIKADSCDADEFMPEYCRVNESDETNNESAKITVTLP